MKKTTIAFDVDGTLIRNGYLGDGSPRPNERIRQLMYILSTFKNVRIICWSGGGEVYARQVAREIGVAKYIDDYADKNLQPYDSNLGESPVFVPTIDKPDIAIDDIQDCELGIINLIVREK